MKKMRTERTHSFRSDSLNFTGDTALFHEVSDVHRDRNGQKLVTLQNGRVRPWKGTQRAERASNALGSGEDLRGTGQSHVGTKLGWALIWGGFLHVLDVELEVKQRISSDIDLLYPCP